MSILSVPQGTDDGPFFFQASTPFRYGNLNRDPGMRLYQSLSGGGANRFHTTRWSVVLVSAQSHAPGYKEALGDLCKLYWYPAVRLYSAPRLFVRRCTRLGSRFFSSPY